VEGTDHFMEKLKKNLSFKGRPGPLVFVVMDGVGLSPNTQGNAVQKAYKPTLDELMSKSIFMKLQAHGCAVGLPSNSDMGNSEVGHNAIGAGRVFEQGAKLVNLAIETGQLWKGETWKKLISNCRPKGTLHFIGLFSDGNVHSHMNHLKAMIKEAVRDGVTRLRVHILLDGRDVG
jgi:2,3-bisphosphoglycerate-independent phosphoglycerate mutase